MSKQTLRDKIAETVDHATGCRVHDEAAYVVADAVLDLLREGPRFDEAVERGAEALRAGRGGPGLKAYWRSVARTLLRAALGEDTPRPDDDLDTYIGAPGHVDSGEA